MPINWGSRLINTEESIPVEMSERKRRAAVIPPFAFVGELEISLSGFWYPTSTMELLKASVSASGPGQATAVFSLLKEEPGNPNPIPIIREMTLGATTTKKVYNIASTDTTYIVTPYDKIFVASWAESLHNGIVIQMVGSLMT